MSEGPERPPPHTPGGEPPPRQGQPERDAFGNPLPSGGSQAQPAGPAPAYGPPPGWAPPAGQPPSTQPTPTHPPPDYPPPPAQAPSAYPPPAGYAYPPPAGWPQVAPPALAGFTLASWWSRVAATLLDVVFIILSFFPAVLALIADLDTLGGLLMIAAGVWTYFLYAPVFMMRSAQRNGQTPGKQLVGIRVVREDRQPIGYGWALLRELVVKGLLIGAVGSWFFGIPTLLDYLWPLWDEQNRALHDMIVSTRVVEARPQTAG